MCLGHLIQKTVKVQNNYQGVYCIFKEKIFKREI